MTNNKVKGKENDTKKIYRFAPTQDYIQSFANEVLLKLALQISPQIIQLELFASKYYYPIAWDKQ